MSFPRLLSIASSLAIVLGPCSPALARPANGPSAEGSPTFGWQGQSAWAASVPALPDFVLLPGAAEAPAACGAAEFPAGLATGDMRTPSTGGGRQHDGAPGDRWAGGRTSGPTPSGGRAGLGNWLKVPALKLNGWQFVGTMGGYRVPTTLQAPGSGFTLGETYAYQVQASYALDPTWEWGVGLNGATAQGNNLTGPRGGRGQAMPTRANRDLGAIARQTVTRFFTSSPVPSLHLRLATAIDSRLSLSVAANPLDLAPGHGGDVAVFALYQSPLALRRHQPTMPEALGGVPVPLLP